MPDPTPPPPPPAPQPKRTPGVINKKYLKEIQDSRTVAAATVNSDYTAALTAVELDDTLPAQVNTLAGQLEAGLGLLVGTRAGKREMTTQENAARDALIAVLAPIQTAAKRKFKGDTADQRAAYFIGQPLTTVTLEEVLTAARAIRDRLTPGANNAPPTDVLPGIKANGRIKDLQDAITLYDTKNTAQGEQQTAAGLSLEELDAKAHTLAGLRHDLQLAADQAFPWRTANVKTIRKAFLLPEDRPLGE